MLYLYRFKLKEMKKNILFSLAALLFIFGIDVFLSDLLTDSIDLKNSALTAFFFALIVFGVLWLRKSIVDMKKEKKDRK